MARVDLRAMRLRYLGHSMTQVRLEGSRFAIA